MLKQFLFRSLFEKCCIQSLCWLFAAQTAAFAGAPNPVRTLAIPKIPEPQLRILRPKPDENFGLAAIFLDLAVEHFGLVAPCPIYDHNHVHGEANPKPVGHIHVYLDSYPLIATSSRRLMFGLNESGVSLPPGKHIFMVELVHTNHQPLTPRKYKRVYFFTTAAEDMDPNESGDRGDTVSGVVQ